MLSITFINIDLFGFRKPQIEDIHSIQEIKPRQWD